MSVVETSEKRSSSIDKVEKYADETTEGILKYEEAAVNVGAPVELVSPLGYHVGPVSVVFLSVGKMIGTGVFTTRERLPLPFSAVCIQLNCYGITTSWIYPEGRGVCGVESDFLGYWVRFCRG